MIHWETKLQEWCEKIGASHAGLADLKTPLTWDHYQGWLDQGFAGEMTYLAQHADQKKNPQNWKPSLRSAIVVAFPYFPHPEGPPPFASVRTAMYVGGQDYHYWIKRKLFGVIEEIQALFPNETFEMHTDASPILERDLAYRAGLGWYGKNTCLIHPKKGSLFLIGEILTSLKFDQKTEPLPDFCGTCQKCLEACPTQALKSPKVLDATRCISYLTIESRHVPSEELRSKIGDWFFGCDICQTVCPWNQKVFRSSVVAQASASDRLSALNQTAQFTPVLQLSSEEKEKLLSELRWVLTSSHNQILKKIRGTPLYRAGAKGLKRNALIVTGNRGLAELRDCVEALRKNTHLGELAEWALKRL